MELGKSIDQYSTTCKIQAAPSNPYQLLTKTAKLSHVVKRNMREHFLMPID